MGCRPTGLKSLHEEASQSNLVGPDFPNPRPRILTTLGRDSPLQADPRSVKLGMAWIMLRNYGTSKICKDLEEHLLCIQLRKYCTLFRPRKPKTYLRMGLGLFHIVHSKGAAVPCWAFGLVVWPAPNFLNRPTVPKSVSVGFAVPDRPFGLRSVTSAVGVAGIARRHGARVAL